MDEKTAVAMQVEQLVSVIQLSQVEGQSSHILVVPFAYCLVGHVAEHLEVSLLPY